MPHSPRDRGRRRRAAVHVGLLALVLAIGFGGALRVQPAPDAAPSAAAPRDAVVISPVARLAIDDVETVTRDPATGRIAVSAGRAVHLLELAGDRLRRIAVVDVAARTGIAGSVSSVVADPAGRGLLAVTIVPDAAGVVQGSVALLDAERGSIAAVLPVGFGPDAAAFTPSGSHLVVACEGEPEIRDEGGVLDPVAAVSVVDLDGVETPEALARLDRSAVATLTPAVRTAGVRIHPRNRFTPALDLEPEYVACTDELAYVVLQENNAIGIIDLDELRWTRIVPLGGITQRVDAVDDGRIDITDEVLALPMPDQIAIAETPAGPVLLTANEGDRRGRLERGRPEPFADSAPVGWLQERRRAAGPAGRSTPGLRVCAISGDTDGDGRIERPAMLGARSLSVHALLTLERLGDTGSSFEEAMAELAPELFNANVDGGVVTADARSTERGPEPEGVAAARMGERVIAVVTLERPGAVACVDVTDPRRPRLAGAYVAARDGDRGPEGATILEATPEGFRVAVAFESSGTLVVYEVTPADAGRR